MPRYSESLYKVELLHLLVGIWAGILPWDWAKILFIVAILWKEFFYDPDGWYGCWLLDVPDDATYEWGLGKWIGFKWKAVLDMFCYYGGLGIGYYAM